MKHTIIALRTLIFFMILTGILYPFMVTVVANIFFPWKSNGSILYKNGAPVASILLAQPIQSKRFFRYRPSASEFATHPSGASNLGPTSSLLKERIEMQTMELKKIYQRETIPDEMVLTSGSGLDPHITTEAAILQLPAIVKERNLSAEDAKKILEFILASSNKVFFENQSITNVNELNYFLIRYDSH